MGKNRSTSHISSLLKFNNTMMVTTNTINDFKTKTGRCAQQQLHKSEGTIEDGQTTWNKQVYLELIEGFERLQLEVDSYDNKLNKLKFLNSKTNVCTPHSFKIDVNHNVNVPLVENICQNISSWFSTTTENVKDAILPQRNYTTIKNSHDFTIKPNRDAEGKFIGSNTYKYEIDPVSPISARFFQICEFLWNNKKISLLSLSLIFSLCTYITTERNVRYKGVFYKYRMGKAATLFWSLSNICTFLLSYMITMSYLADPHDGIHALLAATNDVDANSMFHTDEGFSEDPLREDEEAVADAHSFDDGKEIFADILVLTSSLLVGYRAKDPVNSFFKDITKFSKNQRENLIDILTTSSKIIFRFLEIIQAPEQFRDFFSVTNFSDDRVELVIKKARQFISEANAGLIFHETFTHIVYVELVADIKKLLKCIDSKSYDHRALTTCLVDLEKLSVTLQTFDKSLSGDRIEPVGLLIAGAPGVLKTVLMERITHAFTEYTLPDLWAEDFKEDHSKFIYSAPADKFHDGYNYKSWVYVMDDLFQKREGVADPEADSPKIIKLINTAPYNLQIANVNEKNTKFMRSAMVAATTNANIQELEKYTVAVNESEAVARRFHFTLKVTINDKYHIGQRLVSDALPRTELTSDLEETYSSTYIPEDFWIIELTTWESSKKIDHGVVSLIELIALIVERYNKHVKNYYMNKVTNSQASARMKKLLAERLGRSNRYGTWFSTSEFNSRPDPVFSPQSFDPEPDIEMQGVSDYLSMTSSHANEEFGHLVLFLKNQGLEPEMINILSQYHASNPKSLTPDVLAGYIYENELYFISKIKNYKNLSSDEFKELYAPALIDKNKEFNDDFRAGINLYRDNNCMLHTLSGLLEDYRCEYVTRETLTEWDKRVLLTTDDTSINYEVTFRSELWAHSLSHQVGNTSLNDLLRTFSDKELSIIIRQLSSPLYFSRAICFMLQERVKRGELVLTGEIPTWYETISKTFDATFHSVKSTLSMVCNFIIENKLMIFLGVTAFSGAIYAISKAVRFFFSGNTTESKTADSHSLDMSRNSGRTKMTKTLKLSKNIGKLKLKHPQSFTVKDVIFDQMPKLTYSDFGAQTNVNSILANIFNKHFFNVYATFDFGGDPVIKRVGHCWNLTGQIFGCPFHFIFVLDAERKKPGFRGATLTISTPTKSNCYKVSIEDFLNNFEASEDSADNDFCVFKLRQAQLSSTGIYKYLLSEDDFRTVSKNSSFPINIVGTELRTDRQDVSTLHTRFIMTQAALTSKTHFSATWDAKEYSDVYIVNRTLTYPKSFNAGDCGAIICLNSNQFQNRILIGMHIGGYEKFGIGSVVTRNMIDHIVEIFGELDNFVHEEVPNFLHDVTPIPHGNFVAMKRFNESHSLNPNSTSDIKKSRLFGKLPEPYNVVTKRPVNLNPKINQDGSVHHPLEDALLNYGFPPESVDDDVILQASSSYEQLVREKTTDYKERRTWTLREALHAKDNVKGIPSSTSSGFPMNLKDVDDLKKAYLNAWNAGNFVEAEVQYDLIEKEIDKLIQMYKTRTRPFFVYFDFPKDEIRDPGKLCRMIAGSPFLYFVLMRMYFGAFVDAYVGANLEVGSAIGINPFSSEWDHVARKLKTMNRIGKHTLVGAGDYKNYDGHQQPFSLNEVLHIINSWYGRSDPESNTMRTLLWAEITNSRHSFNNDLVEWFNSMPSGNPLTPIINTMNNNILFRCAWILLDNPIGDFNSSVYLIALGDDNLFSVTPDYHTTFNEMLLPDAMASLGMIYTTELKDEAIVPFRPLTEVEFLKRKFRFSKEAGRYVAPLRVDSMVNMVNWTKKTKQGKDRKSSDQITVDNIATALREFALHGEKEYSYWYDVLIGLKEEYYPTYKFESLVHSNYRNALTDSLSNEHSWLA